MPGIEQFFQFILVILLGILAYGLNRVLSIFYTQYQNKYSIRYVLLPTIYIILLSIALVIFAKLQKNYAIITIVTQITFAVFLIACVYLATNNRRIIYILSAVITIWQIGEYFDVVKPTLLILDNYSIGYAGFHFSLLKLITSITVCIALIFTVRVLHKMLMTYLRSTTLDKHTVNLITKIIVILAYFIIILTTLNIIGIDITAIAVIGSAIGVGIGLGMQKIAASFVSGVILFIEKSIKVGDLLELKDGFWGHVADVNIRYTRIHTQDGKDVIVPNDELMYSTITNLTNQDYNIRIRININVEYRANVNLVEKLILEAAKECPDCLHEPKPLCFITNFGDNGINYLLMFWVDNVEKGTFKPKSEIMANIWHKFKKYNINFPFPQRDIYIKEQP